jgi:hypothetical protein
MAIFLNFKVILVYFSSFGMLCQENSGNPGLKRSFSLLSSFMIFSSKTDLQSRKVSLTWKGSYRSKQFAAISNSAIF